MRVLATALVLAGAAALAGCSSSYMVIDAMPSSVGGLPEHTPERPATPPAYPAVHDMPPGRSDVTLTDAEKKRLREELAATRERAARQAANPDGTGATPASGNARNP
jgi:hypothetical protein